MRRFLVLLAFVVIAGTCIAGLIGSTAQVSAAPPPVHTVTCNLPDGSCTGTYCTAGAFFGLVPWYQYLQLRSVQIGAEHYCEPVFSLLPTGSQPSSLPLILLAIVDDLVRVAGFVALGYVIWGGAKYITSQGSPEGTKNAQQTVLNAVIGLTIAIVATAFVSYLGKKLTGA